MTTLILQFDDAHVEPFNFFHRQEMNLSQKLDDFRLGWVHEGIMAVAVVRDAEGQPGDGGTIL